MEHNDDERDDNREENRSWRDFVRGNPETASQSLTRLLESSRTVEKLNRSSEIIIQLWEQNITEFRKHIAEAAGNPEDFSKRLEVIERIEDFEFASIDEQLQIRGDENAMKNRAFQLIKQMNSLVQQIRQIEEKTWQLEGEFDLNMLYNTELDFSFLSEEDRIKVKEIHKLRQEVLALTKKKMKLTRYLNIEEVNKAKLAKKQNS